MIVQSRMTAHDGEMVIALIDEEGATVKRFYREAGGMVRLQPANADLSPMRMRADRVRIQGIVVGVIRRY